MEEWGPYIDTLQRHAENGGNVPALENCPELDAYQRWVYQAFQSLTQSRQIGMNGPQPISVSEINAYCQLKRIQDLDERQRFTELVKAMDRTYLESVRED